VEIIVQTESWYEINPCGKYSMYRLVRTNNVLEWHYIDFSMNVDRYKDMPELPLRGRMDDVTFPYLEGDIESLI